jgi:hypothetical protein
MMWLLGIETKIATSPKTIRPSSAQNSADEEPESAHAAQVAPDAGAERGEPDRDGDEPDDLAQQLPSAVARDRFAGHSRLAVGGLDGVHEVSSFTWVAEAGRRQRRRVDRLVLPPNDGLGWDRA